MVVVTTRTNIPQELQNNQPTDLKQGFDTSFDSDNVYDPTINNQGLPVASCGLEDVDVGVFNLFKDELGFNTKQIQTKQGDLSITKPVVVFAAGERFANVKRLRPIRDKNGALILPAISIRRTGLQQTDEDINGRGISQNAGPIVIKRRIDAQDPFYQTWLNKQRLKNTKNSQDSNSSLSQEDNIANKYNVVLEDSLGNNIFEVISVPSPQFYTASYEVVFWTIHHQHMNYMIETLFNSFLPQRRGLKITTTKGYWFLADVGEEITNDGNEDDWTEDKRIVRYSFPLTVQAYFFAASNLPGQPSPFTRYVSSPKIAFDIVSSKGSDIQARKNLNRVVDETDSKFLLSEIQTNESEEQVRTTDENYAELKQEKDNTTGKTIEKYVPFSSRETTGKFGESVYSTPKFNSLDSFVLSLKDKRN
jgi:hypothetical protein